MDETWVLELYLRLPFDEHLSIRLVISGTTNDPSYFELRQSVDVNEGGGGL